MSKRVTPIFAIWKDVERELERPLPLPYAIACSYRDDREVLEELKKRRINHDRFYIPEFDFMPRVRVVVSRLLKGGSFHIFETYQQMKEYVALEDDTKSRLWDEWREMCEMEKAAKCL